MKINFPTASMGKSFGGIFITIPLIVLVTSLLCLGGPSARNLWILICILAAALIYFWPTFIAWDISDRIPEIEKAKKENKNLGKITIKHQSFWIVFLVNLLFGWSIIGWIVAFAMAHGQSDSNIPYELQGILQTRESNSDPLNGLPGGGGVPPTVPSPAGAGAIETRLAEVNSLLSKGIISQAEADMRREVILKTVI